MAIEIPNFIPAACGVTASAHVLSPPAPVVFTWLQSFNKASCTHTVLGVYDLVLDEPLADGEMGAIASEVGSNIGGSITVVSVDDFHKRVETRNSGGTAVDTMSFYLEMRREPGIPASFSVPTASL